MEYRPLGKSWIEASVVSFGAWAIGRWSWGGKNALLTMQSELNPRLPCPTNLYFKRQNQIN